MEEIPRLNVFRFPGVKNCVIEKISERNTKPIAQKLDSYNSGVFAVPVQNALER